MLPPKAGPQERLVHDALLAEFSDLVWLFLPALHIIIRDEAQRPARNYERADSVVTRGLHDLVFVRLRCRRFLCWGVNSPAIFWSTCLNFQVSGICQDWILKANILCVFAEFPEGQNGKAINEWLFLLATKIKFEALDMETSENFHKRLDELGRENWRSEQIGYTILSE